MSPLETCEMDQASVALWTSTYSPWCELSTQLLIPYGEGLCASPHFTVGPFSVDVCETDRFFVMGSLSLGRTGAKTISHIIRRSVTFHAMNNATSNQSSWKPHWIQREAAGPFTNCSELNASFQGRRLSVIGSALFYFLNIFSVLPTLRWK